MTTYRKSDLTPALGYPGGPCQVIERIRNEVPRPSQQEALVDLVEEGVELDNAKANVVYDLEVEKGPTKKYPKMEITPHAQYRMDFRGVNVSDLKLFFQDFMKLWGDLKSQNHVTSRRWEESMARNEAITWTNRFGLTVVFTVLRDTLRVVTVYWDGLKDPKGVDESACRVASRYAASKIPVTPGVTTFVSPKSQKDLPTGIDREKEQVLPLPGSATPGGAGRDVPTFNYTTPGPMNTQNRTVGVPGEEYGHPTKYDYNMPTRRSMTARGDKVKRASRNASTPLVTRPAYSIEDCVLERVGGDIVLYTQENPANSEINQPGADVGYRAQGPSTYTNAPDEKAGVPMGDTFINNTRYDNTPPATGRVVPTSMGQTLQDNYSKWAVKHAALIQDIMAKCSPSIAQGAAKVSFRRLRIDLDKGFLLYEADGSKGEKYKVRIKGVRKGGVKALAKMPVRVSCTCPFFQWQGPEHWAKANGFLYGKPMGTATKPDVKDPKGQHWVCKHIYAVLKAKENLRFASTEWEFSGLISPGF